MVKIIGIITLGIIGTLAFIVCVGVHFCLQANEEINDMRWKAENSKKNI